MHKEIETMKSCKHPDCIYRGKISGNIKTCEYIIWEHQSRGCKISECDKYRTGKKVVRDSRYFIEMGIDFDEVTEWCVL